MNIKIPLLPISALLFYLLILILWIVRIIPDYTAILQFLEGLYNSYGLLGLFIASFLEGVVYLGLYFPGSVIIALSVILSNGSFLELLIISLIVALALTLTSIINYLLGKSISKKKVKENKKFSKGIIFSIIHPNVLAFYFFNLGIKKNGFWKVLFVPLLMIPYGLLIGYLIYSVKPLVERAIESPILMISIILIWFIIAFIFDNRKD